MDAWEECLTRSTYSSHAHSHLVLYSHSMSAHRSVCPFRFLHGRGTQRTASDATSGDPDVSTGASIHGEMSCDRGKPRESPAPVPPVFGFGKHMCPGRELANLELVTVLRRFLTEFDFHIVEGQVGCVKCLKLLAWSSSSVWVFLTLEAVLYGRVLVYLES